MWFFLFCFFKQKPAYALCSSDCSSDVCSSDLQPPHCPVCWVVFQLMQNSVCVCVCVRFSFVCGGLYVCEVYVCVCEVCVCVNVFEVCVCWVGGTSEGGLEHAEDLQG